jgi:hypothetical protein
MPDPERFAIVADLVESRLAEDRSEAAQRIRAAMRAIGRNFRTDFLAPPVHTKGIDEFSAVLARPDHLFDVAVAVNLEVWPMRFRFGVGGGTIDVGARSKDASAMDGPAFHRAADALHRANEDRLAFALELPGRDPAQVAVIEALGAAHKAISADWTQSAARVVTTYRRRHTQVATARMLGVSQQFVSKELERAHYRTLEQIESAAREWFSSLPRQRSRK